MSSEQQQRIMGYFIEEAKDHLNTIEQGLLNLQSTIEDPDLISEVFRAAHSVKGGAAMLGIDSVQQMSHRLEDCFKILKDHPVPVDRSLESLFLQVFDALKALIEQLQSPFGLTDRNADNIVRTATPVVDQLQRQLDQLLRSGETRSSAAPAPEPAPAASSSAGPLSAEAQQFFQTEVPGRLRQMLQLFKRSDDPESRQQLHQCCEHLLRGDGAELPAEWCHLVEDVQRAIAEPTNSYRQLAPVVIKNLKRAQENATENRAHAIEVSDDLLSLVPAPEVTPEHEPESELDRLLAEASLTDQADESGLASLEAAAAGDDSGEAMLDDLDLFSDPDAELTAVNVADMDSLAELFDAEPEASDPLDLDLGRSAEPSSPDPLDLEPAQPTGPVDESEFLQEDASAEEITSDAGENSAGDNNAGDDLSTLLETAPESSASSLVSALSETADSDLDELFGDLLGDEESEATEPDNADTGAEQAQSWDEAIDGADILRSGQPSDAPEHGLQALPDLSDLFAESSDAESPGPPPAPTDELFQEGTSDLAVDSSLDLLLGDDSAQDDQAHDQSSDVAVDESSADGNLDDFFSSFDSEGAETVLGAEDDGNEDADLASLMDEGAQPEPFEAGPADGADFDFTDNDPAEAALGRAVSSDNEATGDDDGELGFDVSTVNVTDDIWADEGDESWVDAIELDLDEQSPSSNSENDRDVQQGEPDLGAELSPELDAELDADLSAELTDSGLDQLFSDVEPLPDIFSQSDVPLDQGAEAAAAVPVQSENAPSENAPGDDLFADLSGDDDDDEPFSFEGLTVDEQSSSPDEGDRIFERLEDWDADAPVESELELALEEESPEAPESAETTSIDADPMSEFDDLLSIGSPSVEAPETDPGDDIDSLLGDRAPEDLGVDLEADSEANSAPELDLTGDGTDVFSDLDALLEGTDADIHADLQSVEPDMGIDPALASDLAEPYDVSGSDLRYPESEASLESEQIEAAIQGLEEDDSQIDALLEHNEDSPEMADDFADLEKLLEQADETLGGNPIPATALRLNSPGRRQSRGPTLGNQTMRVSVKNLDNLNNLVGELVVNRNSLEQSQDRLGQFLDNLLSQVQQLGDLGQRIRDLYERSLLESSLRSSRPQQTAAFTAEASATHVTGARFDALEMDRFTGFHTLSQEIIELIVRVREAASDINFIVEQSEQGTRTLRQITTELQEGINHTRMVPFSQAADRLHRAVRDISVKFNKQAELVVEGRDTLVDKMILEQLYDPMTHLVNNAITHGIEQSEERVAAGKSPVGRITLRAFHQGNQTIISVTDDGAGINAQKVKEKALERGLISQREAGTMSQLDIYDLLFHHGFSTRDKADDFAGRGVGMDVVRTSLNEVRGTVNIDSTVGKGTTFTIRLPLTLSISKALLCVSDRARIAFPMDGVEDMFDIAHDRVKRNEAGQTCIPWRDTMLPFRPLSNLLKFNRTIGRGSVYGGSQDDDMISIVVLRSAGNHLALQVDQVLEEREIVIKQLEPPVPKPAGIAGATVLGDGRVMPITDVLELIDLSLGRSRRELAREDEPPIEAKTAEAREPTVLIVDDSITVRELLSMTFAKVGYRVEQARDGQEAWEKLKSGLPCDLVFCDIEMPRMDGLELLSRLQKDDDLEALPIAMLTSRGADRHRQMAVDLGAKGYFTKPYLEEALLEAAQRMLSGETLVG
ncbi:MAG: response regulator [Elainellaceae cyanobacterium]